MRLNDLLDLASNTMSFEEQYKKWNNCSTI
ncbi:hypothetical protein Dip510_001454 [Elusimicrobium posterum]